MKTILPTLALFLIVPAMAAADIPPPEVEACAGKKVGDSCVMWAVKGEGSCQKTTCSKTLPGPNGPVTSTRDCVKCLPKPAKTDKKDDTKKDDSKKDDSKKDEKKNSAGVMSSPGVAFGAGAGVLLLGLLAARRFGRDDA